MTDDRPCTCPPMERPHPCARKFALAECKAATMSDTIKPAINITLTDDGKATLYNPSGITLNLGFNLFYDESALAAAREQALEEAASVCERPHMGTIQFHVGREWCADAIRALKEKK